MKVEDHDLERRMTELQLTIAVLSSRLEGLERRVLSVAFLGGAAVAGAIEGLRVVAGG